MEEMLIVAGDLNGHIGERADGYEGVHGGFGYGARNDDGNRILETAVALELVVCNTMFMKEESKLITFMTANVKSVLDYILIRQRNKGMVLNAKVIPGEECVSGHKLVVVDLKLEKMKRRSHNKFVPKLRVWKLNKQPFRDEFVAVVQQRAVEVADAGGVENKWLCMKGIWLDAAEKVVGKSKGRARHKATWWWNDTVAKVVEEKRTAYRNWYKSKTTVDLDLYKSKRKQARKEIAMAKQTKRAEVVSEMKLEEHPTQRFKVIKRMLKDRQDISGVNCLKDAQGKLVVDEEKVKDTWKQYMEKLMNEENTWDNNTASQRKEGPCCRINQDEVRKALRSMRKNKAPGLSGITVEVMKVDEGLSEEWLTDLCNCIIDEGQMPQDWKNSILVPLYKGKGDPLECGSYRGIKLLEQAMKVVERVLEQRIRQQVDIDNMQFGFMPGKGTTDAIFIVRQVMEKFSAKSRNLYMAFVDLEKAFDRIPREVLRWAMRELGVEEWLVSTVMAMYEGVKTVVRTPFGDSESFEVRVGVHQGSVLSPLLFAVVMQAITRSTKVGLPWELLYADDLVLMAESMDELISKINRWKESMERKGMKVNVAKTKVMITGVKMGKEVRCKWPCGVCGKGVGNNSVKCVMCEKWIHKRCSGIKGNLSKVCGTFVCAKCKGKRQTAEALDGDIDIGNGCKLEKVARFCYLGDTIGAEGGSEQAISSRICGGWNRFRELASFLCSKDISLAVRGMVYDVCVRSCVLYGSETWCMKMEDEMRIERNDRKMIRCITGVKLSDKISSDELRRRLNLDDI